MSLDIYLTRILCEHCKKEEEIFHGGMTHNLNTMAEKADIYKHLWRPEELGITKAKDLIEPLKKGLKRLKQSPDYYKKFNPSNGYGTYEILVKQTENYLKACRKYPNSNIEADR